MNELYLFYEESIVGTLTNHQGELGFTYDQNWREFPISFQFSDFEKRYPTTMVETFFENLMPEGEVRASLESIEQLEKDDPFSYLEHHGSDLIGAFSIRKLKEQTKKLKPTKREISSSELYEIFSKERGVINYWKEHPEIEFSIPGAQEKCSIYYSMKKIYFYSNMASNYIVKGPHHVLKFPNSSVFNEYFCLKLAKRLGLGVIDCNLVGGVNSPLLFVKRYDREKGKRLHQLDFLQCLQRKSKFKYERRGGPKLKELFLTLKKYSTDAKDWIRFLDWVLLNILIGNNDSHAKNLAFIVTNKGYRLAPFYDLVSTAIYSNEGITKKFAFSLNGQDDPKKFRLKHLRWLCSELEIREDYLEKRLKKHLLPKMDKALSIERDKFTGEFGPNKTVDDICEYINKRVNFFLQDR